MGLLLTSFGLGLRHGVDWDHIAAIADLSSSAPTRRRGYALSFLYAIGHAAVVFALGVAAIAFGSSLPSGFDEWMGRIAGLTLIALGLWVAVELARHGRDFRLRSRWMLILDGTFAGLRRVRTRRGGRRVSVEHEHGHEHVDETHETQHAHDHAHQEVEAIAPVPAVVVGASSAGRLRSRRHSHRHRHELALPSTASPYGTGTATGVGMLHGVGVESPTQIAIFVASTSIAGTRTGIVLLLAWVVGLVAANSILAVLAGFGMLHAEKNFAVYATIASVVAITSVVVGTALVFGADVLPAIEL